MPELVVQHQNCPLPLKAWIFDHKPALRESEERRLALLQNGPQGQPGALPAPADAAEARRRERKAAQDARKEKRRVEQLARRAAIGAEHHPAVSVDTGAVPANSSQRPGILSTAGRVLFVLLALLALGRCTGVIGGGDELGDERFCGHRQRRCPFGGRHSTDSDGPMTPAPGWKDTGSDYLSRRRARRGDSGGWGTAAVPSEGNGTATPSGWGSGTGARAGDPAGLDATGWGSMAQGSTAIAGTQSPVRRFEGSPRLPLTTLALVLVGGLGLGICVRQFLASIDIVGWIVSGAPHFSGALLVVVVLLGLVAVAGVVLAIVVLFRRPPRWVGAALLAASLLLPLCASWGGANSGYIAFQRGLLWDVRTQGVVKIEPGGDRRECLRLLRELRSSPPC